MVDSVLVCIALNCLALQRTAQLNAVLYSRNVLCYFVLQHQTSGTSKSHQVYTSVFSNQKIGAKEIIKVPFKDKPLEHVSKAKLSGYPMVTSNHLNLLSFLGKYQNFQKSCNAILIFVQFF